MIVLNVLDTLNIFIFSVLSFQSPGFRMSDKFRLKLVI